MKPAIPADAPPLLTTRVIKALAAGSSPECCAPHTCMCSLPPGDTNAAAPSHRLPAGQVLPRPLHPLLPLPAVLLSRDFCCSGLDSALSSQAAPPLISANPDPSCPKPISLILPALVSSSVLTAARCTMVTYPFYAL